MNTDDGRLGVNVTHDEGDGAFDPFCGSGRVLVAWLRVGYDAFKTKNAKVALAGGEIGVGNLCNAFERHMFNYTNPFLRLCAKAECTP